MDYRQLPIWRQANLLLLSIEQAVRQFLRYHKYSLGTELRHKAMRICQVIHRVVSRKNSKHKLLQQLSELIDDLKLQIQLAKELKAFRSFKQFQSVVALVVSLGRQAGGWLKQTRAELSRQQGTASVPTHCASGSPQKGYQKGYQNAHPLTSTDSKV